MSSLDDLEVESRPPWLRPARLSAWLVGAIIILAGLSAWLAIEKHHATGQVGDNDAMADWLVTKAFADGIDPTSGLFELADVYGVDFWDEEGSRFSQSPRTPGSLLVLLPLAWVGAESVTPLVLVVGAVCTAWGVLAIARIGVVSYVVLFGGLVYALFLGPGIWSQKFGTHVPVILLCVAVAYALLRDHDSIGGGIWLAIGATLRIFPGILLIALLGGRRFKAAGAMSATLVLLNLVPLLSPHVSLGATLEAMTSTTTAWFNIESNISLARGVSRFVPTGTPIIVVLGLILFGVGWALVRRRTLSVAAQWTLLLSTGILALPLAWPQYLLAVVPAAMVAAEDTTFYPRFTAFLGVAGVAMTIPVWPTAFYALGLVLMIVALGWIARSESVDQGLSATSR